MMEMVSSPARKLDDAMARSVLRGVLPKKEADGLEELPVADEVAILMMLLLFMRVKRLSAHKMNYA